MSFKPVYEKMHEWDTYCSTLAVKTEYKQCIEEGLDVEKYKALFDEIAPLPQSEAKKLLCDGLFELIRKAKTVEGYKYNEPSDLEGIRKLRAAYAIAGEVKEETLRDKIAGAWMGRICGCLLGKTVEGIHTDELVPFLKESGNYPMYRYIRSTDVTEETKKKYKYPLAERCFADLVDGMPMDDDTNYVALAQLVIERYGRDFTPWDMSRAWLSTQPKDAYCTAERVAFLNFTEGIEPPYSAEYQNPYREWIGAQIRGDYFGYINPGDPELAAEMAWRDACISHIKNGIYGEMFAAAMIAVAGVTKDLKDIVLGGLAQIPYTSRLYEDVMSVVTDWENGVSQEEAFKHIHEKWDEHIQHDWCHTNSNAMIVAAALLYGKGDFGKSICMAVETGFDTDCNGATVGSILGMAFGEGCIDEVWSKDIHNKLYTSIFGVGDVLISDCVEKTMKHIAM